MKKYKVEIIETSIKIVELEANNEIEAEIKVQQMYDEQEIILDYQDYTETEINCIE